MNERIPVGKINSSHISKTIAVEGRIDKIYPIKARLIHGAFRCQRCEHISHAQQSISDKIIKPYECENDVCGGKGHFELVPEESEWIDEQRLKLKDPNGHDRDIMVYVRGKDLIDTIPSVDSHIVVTGVVKVLDDGSSSIFERVLEASHIETIEIGKDINIINVGVGKSFLDKMKVLKGIIRELQEEHKSSVPLEDIIPKAEESGIKKKDVLEIMQKMKTVGELLEVTNGRFRAV